MRQRSYRIYRSFGPDVAPRPAAPGAVEPQAIYKEIGSVPDHDAAA
jgi:hypothetical protein